MTGIYAGTFDPITKGHLDIIKKASVTFDKVVVAIGENPNKKTQFDLFERTRMIKNCTELLENVTVDSFYGLLVDYVKEQNSNTIIRGIRGVSDLEYEFQVGYANESLDSGINTIFFMPDLENSFISSSTFRAIFKEAGLEKSAHLLPLEVVEYIKNLDGY